MRDRTLAEGATSLDEFGEMIGRLLFQGAEPLSDAERVSLVSGIICCIADKEGVSASEVVLRASESFIASYHWQDAR